MPPLNICWDEIGSSWDPRVIPRLRGLSAEGCCSNYSISHDRRVEWWILIPEAPLHEVCHDAEHQVVLGLVCAQELLHYLVDHLNLLMVDEFQWIPFLGALDFYYALPLYEQAPKRMFAYSQIEPGDTDLGWLWQRAPHPRFGFQSGTDQDLDDLHREYYPLTEYLEHNP